MRAEGRGPRAEWWGLRAEWRGPRAEGERIGDDSSVGTSQAAYGPQPSALGPRPSALQNVTLIDSPVANVANIARALRTVGTSLDVTRDASAIARAAKLVLPGVGSFKAAMSWLTENGIDAAIRAAVDNGASLLGICVGHQLLFDASHEMGITRGLGLVSGEVRQFHGPLPVPQIGWNAVRMRGASEMTGGACPPLFDGIADGAPFYFVNSYAAIDAPDEIARADYAGPFTAAVQRGRVFGVQFHPEKSSQAGLRVLRNFVAWT